MITHSAGWISPLLGGFGSIVSKKPPNPFVSDDLF